MSASEVSLEGVFEALALAPRKGKGGGRALMFIAARRGEGVTSLACMTALNARAGIVYAIDLDMRRNSLAKALAEHGPLGPKLDGRLDGARFYSLLDARGFPLAEREPLFGYHRVDKGRVYAGVFDGRALPAGARILMSAAPDYWQAGRARGALMVVDAPALARSQVGLRVAAHMDGVVLVVAGDAGGAPAAVAAKAQLNAAGANVLGIIYAKASAPVAAMDRLLRQAG